MTAETYLCVVECFTGKVEDGLRYHLLTKTLTDLIVSVENILRIFILHQSATSHVRYTRAHILETS